MVVTHLILTKANRLIACGYNLLSQTESNENDAEIFNKFEKFVG